MLPAGLQQRGGGCCGKGGRSCSWRPSPCPAARPRCVWAPIPSSAAPGRVMGPSAICHPWDSPDLASASECFPVPVEFRAPALWSGTQQHALGLALIMGFSGLKKHPKSSEPWTGMAILSIKYNIYHNLLLKLSGDASPPFHGPTLQKKGIKVGD